jgi:hypothetical protein
VAETEGGLQPSCSFIDVFIEQVWREGHLAPFVLAM